MKFVALAFGVMLATACYAQAEPAPMYGAPPGAYAAPVAVVPLAPMVAAPPPVVDVQMPAAGPRNPNRPNVAALRAEILARFDHNGDGQLEPGELRQAMRALHRIERQLQRENRREQRAERQQQRQMRQQQRQQQQGPREGDPGF